MTQKTLIVFLTFAEHKLFNIYMRLPSFLLALILAILFSFSSGYFFKVSAADITSTWSSSSKIPIPVASAVSISSNSKVFLMGGSNTLDYSNIWSSSINSAPLLSWGNESYPLPHQMFWMAKAEKNDSYYLIGGASLETSNKYLSLSLRIKKDALGNINSFIPSSPLPENLGMGAATIAGDRLYFSGGFRDSYASDKVYSASINSDGSLEEWELTGIMPEKRLGHGMVTYKGYLITLGGSDNSKYLSSVYIAKPDANGLISSWEQAESLPTPIYRASIVTIGNIILVIGGYDGTSSTDKIYYAEINDDGTISPWSISSNHLPSGLHGAAEVVVGENLYIIGGYRAASDSYLDSVYYTKLSRIANEVDLNVELLKQTDPLWRNFEYDSANLWAPPKMIGIDRWGCALTSAAMILRYYGIFRLPDGTVLDPGSLNEWLKKEKDGYLGTGWINWEKISILSKKSKNQNPAFLYDALEFKYGTASSSLIRDDLKNSMPVILEEQGHFIVAKGTNRETFTINDPFYFRNFLTDYGNKFLSIRRYIPSYSDISYIILTTTNNLAVSVKDKAGNLVGDYVIEGRLSNAIDGGNNNSNFLNTYYIPKPESGLYGVEISSNISTIYNLGVYLYDIQGNVSTFSQNGIVGEGKADVFTIKFDKALANSSKASFRYSFDSLISDLDLLFARKEIKKHGVYISLREKIQEAKKKSLRKEGDGRESISIFIKELNSKKKEISEVAFQILNRGAVFLLDSKNNEKRQNDSYDRSKHLEED
ncbi:MAG: C39 family peptidase [Candidatus Levyibacteriota bacterium]